MRFIPSRILLLFVAALMPLSLLGSVYPELRWLLPAGILFCLVLGLVDLYFSSDALLQIRIDFEPTTRLARGTEGEVTLHLRCYDSVPDVVTLGMALPVEFLLDSSTQKVALAGEEATDWAVSWKLTARKRGVYRTPDVYVQARSSMGLFEVRRRFTTKGELRVYPNIRRERKQLANLFLNRGTLGMHTQRIVGQGREYEQLREYAPGDTLTDVHWKASAKRGELVTKTYQIERTQEVYLIIDHSRLSGLRSPNGGREVDDSYTETVLERYVTVASILGMVAEREGDHFGLVAFGKQVSRFVRASSGKHHGQVVQDALFDLETERAPSDLDEIFTFIRARIRRRALLIFLTDLTDAAAAEAFCSRVPMISATHVVLVNTIQHKGVGPLYHSEGAPFLADAVAGHLRWEGLQNLRKSLRSEGVDFGLLDNEQLSLDLVNQYLNVKRRQIL